MKIIAESGATKTSWRAIAQDGSVRSADTAGLSPTCLDGDAVRELVRDAVPALDPEGTHVSSVIFYGAGLVSEESAAPLRDAIQMWCPFAEISFHSDLVAAARALFGDGSGVVAIMGTGSNSCLYEDGRLMKNISPGGYVLGDEGSGVALGRAFLADFVKGLLPGHVEEDFVRVYGLDYPQIVRKVYKEQGASAFMASFAPFVLSHACDPYMEGMIRDNLEAFVRRCLSRYGAYASDSETARKIGVVGSFGCACEDALRVIGGRYGLEFVKFLKSPVDELVKYHGI